MQLKAFWYPAVVGGGGEVGPGNIFHSDWIISFLSYVPLWNYQNCKSYECDWCKDDEMCGNLINGTKILVNKCVLIHIGK